MKTIVRTNDGALLVEDASAEILLALWERWANLQSDSRRNLAELNRDVDFAIAHCLENEADLRSACDDECDSVLALDGDLEAVERELGRRGVALPRFE